MKRLGASKTFDYNSKTVTQDLIHAFKGKTAAGAMSIGSGSADACMDVLHKCQGNKFISMVTFPVPFPPPKRFVLPRVVATFVPWIIANWFKCKIRGIRNGFVDGANLVDNGVGEAIYGNFLSEALGKGVVIASPEANVIGKGLEYVHEGLILQRKGVSAKKIVVALD